MALPDISISELSAVVRAIRARPCRDKHLRAAPAAFAVILAVFLRSATTDTLLPSQARVGAIEENQMIGLQQLAVVSSVAISSASLAQDAVQWRVEDGGNGHWYLVTSTMSTWEAARSSALGTGGDLASLETAREWNWFRSWAPRVMHGLHIGGRQDDGFAKPSEGWRWLTGEPVKGLRIVADDNPYGRSLASIEDAQQNFLHSIDGEDAVGDIEWNGMQLRSVIEWSADCNLDGVVDYGQIRCGSLADTNGDGIPDICRDRLPPGSRAQQWPESDGGNGHWYEITEVSFSTWAEARRHAELHGGHLATLTSRAEQSFAMKVMGGSRPVPGCWLGGLRRGSTPSSGDTSDGWTWVTGEAWGFTAWHPDRRAGRGGAFLVARTGESDRFRWIGSGTHAESGAVPALIEWSTDCDGDGRVDLGQIRTGARTDVNGNSIPDICEPHMPCDPCRADVNDDGVIDAEDVREVLRQVGHCR